MCGGAILAELLPRAPTRRITADHLWPQGWVAIDEFEVPFGEFHEDSEFSGALREPDFTWHRPRRRVLSAFDMITIRPFSFFDLDGVASEPPEHEGMPARASDSNSHALFDALLSSDQFAFFDGDAYESVDSFFSADAVQSNAKAAVGFWSFTDQFVLFDVGAYESLDSLFSAQSNAEAAAGLWSFDND